MRLHRCVAAGLAGLALLAASARAAAPKPAPAPSPLRLLPAEVDLLVQVQDPPRLAKTVAGLKLLGELQAFPQFKELLDSTQSKRGRQLLAYFEKEMGGKWPALLDSLAGGGAAAGFKFGSNTPFLLVIQGKDEKVTAKFVGVALKVVEDELERAESKDKVVKGKYKGVETYQVGPQFFAARAGAALLVSNKASALKHGLDLHLGREKKSLAAVPLVAEGAKLLPKDPLVNAWVNMAPVHASEQGKALYKSPRDDVLQTFFFGHFLDVLGRSPYVVAGMNEDKNDLLLTVRMPRGRSGMGADQLLHVPKEGEVGSRPLLMPKGVLYSDSFYLNLANFWAEREKLFPKKTADDLANFDKGSGRVLAGAKFSALLGQTAPYLRVVAVNQGKTGYTKKSKQTVPAFAVVAELREPEKFGRSMDAVLRGAALLATTQVKLKLAEETHKGCEVVGWRFDEKAEMKADVDDLRFAFSPCYARVGDQFVFCSTLELCRELVDLLQKEQKDKPKGSPKTGRTRFVAAGAADLLAGLEDQLIAQVILDQAVPAAEARDQVKKFIALVRGMGGLDLETTFLDKETRYEFRLRLGKKD